MNIGDVLENSFRIINTQLGRDKTCRFTQYFLKFIIPFLQANGEKNADLVARLSSLATNMSTTRKVLRFGKPIPLIKGIMDRLHENSKRPVRLWFWRTLSDIFLILYFLTDHPLYFQRIGLIKLDKKTVDRIDYLNNVFWLLNALFDLFCDLIEVSIINQEISILRSQLKTQDRDSSTQIADIKNRLRELYVQKFKYFLNIARNGFDLPVIFHFMNNPNFGPKLAGFCGTITSCISLYNLWGK